MQPLKAHSQSHFRSVEVEDLRQPSSQPDADSHVHTFASHLADGEPIHCSCRDLVRGTGRRGAQDHVGID